MSETSFTPGPWAARIEYKKSMLSKHTYTMCSIHADDKCIADVVYVIHDNVDEAIANTRLIAAAPEMYDILEYYFKLIQKASEGDTVAEQKIFEQAPDIEKVLKKARGEE